MQETINHRDFPVLAKSSLPLAGLIIANVIPLIGVIHWDWDAGLLLLLYWSENLVIGFYYIFRILLAGVARPSDLAANLFMALFFSIHYGGFVGGHGLFLIEFIKFGGEDTGGLLKDLSWPMFLVFIELLVNVVQYLFAHMSNEMIIALIALLISHGNSFVINYLIRGEYKTATAKKIMTAPYGRIVIMHIAIIFGGILVMQTGSSLPMLVLLVFIKSAIDIQLHRRSHKKLQQATAQ